jgi:hypothetical protein
MQFLVLRGNEGHTFMFQRSSMDYKQLRDFESPAERRLFGDRKRQDCMPLHNALLELCVHLNFEKRSPCLGRQSDIFFQTNR